MSIMPILCICETAKLNTNSDKNMYSSFQPFFDLFYGLLSTPAWVLNHELVSNFFNLGRDETEDMKGKFM